MIQKHLVSKHVRVTKLYLALSSECPALSYLLFGNDKSYCARVYLWLKRVESKKEKEREKDGEESGQDPKDNDKIKGTITRW